MATLESPGSGYKNEDGADRRKKRARPTQETLGYAYRGSGRPQHPGKKLHKMEQQQQAPLGNDYTFVLARGNAGHNAGQQQSYAAGANGPTSGYSTSNRAENMQAHYRSRQPPFGMPTMTIQHPRNSRPINFRQQIMVQPSSPYRRGGIIRPVHGS